MKKLNLVSLENEALNNNQMQSIKGGGVCACRHQSVDARKYGARRGEIIEKIKIFY